VVVDIARTAGTCLTVHPLHEGLLPHSPIGWLQGVVDVVDYFLEELLAGNRFGGFSRLRCEDLGGECADVVNLGLLGLFDTRKRLPFLLDDVCKGDNLQVTIFVGLLLEHRRWDQASVAITATVENTSLLVEWSDPDTS